LYTVTLNKNFEDWKTSVNLQYSHQTYWDRRTSDYYTLSVNRYFDAFGVKNVSAGLTASRSRYSRNGVSGSGDNYNDSVFLRLSVPWGTGTASYSGSMSNDRYTNIVGYSDTVNGGLDSYSLNAGVNSGGGQPSQSQISAYYNHSSPLA
ncbi:PapC/FimD family outer membrane usher protein, partial [Escherichia marmotae]|nr:PapC/FimD family outer membrane usher protein [Escherichia marmotae]